MKNKNLETKKEMEAFHKVFEGMPDRLLKYCEILLEGKKASPHCYQDSMSFRKLAVSLTTKCNIGCLWCYRDDYRYKHTLNKEMPIETFKKIVENTNQKFREVHLGGLGEPLLYAPLYEAIKLSKKLSPNTKLTTNATLLSKEIIDKLVESGLTDIEISVIGFSKEENMKLRGKNKLNENFNQMVNNIGYASQKLNTQINIVVTNINYNSIMNAIEILKNAKNIKVIHTIQLFVTEQCKKYGIKRVSTIDYIKLLKKLKEDIKKYNLNWELIPPPDGVRKDPIMEMKKKRNICFTCFEDPFISVDGEIIPCCKAMRDGVDATQGFEKAWNHPKLLKFRKNMLEGNYPKLCGDLCYLKSKN